MGIHRFNWNRIWQPSLILLIFFTEGCDALFAQVDVKNGKDASTKNTGGNYKLNAVAGNDKDLFGLRGGYIKNVGQYGDTLAKYGRMGKILYGYEGLEMPVLFTARGMIHLQRKEKKLSYEERERMEEEGMSEEQVRKMKLTVDRIITFEWINANATPEIIAEEIADGYHVYGLLQQKAFAYKKIIYKNLYPGINAEYRFTDNEKPGYEFILVVSPGADISKVKIRYDGDVKSVVADKKGRLVIKSDIDGIILSVPLCYLTDINNGTEKSKAKYFIKNNEVSFNMPENFSPERSFIIDPFVTGTGILTGVNAGIAKDIDFDYAGNIYVSGGGSGAIQMLAKFSPAGILLWTFSGSLTTPFWNFGGSYGGWVVDKFAGNVYLGQGLTGSGFSVVRLNAAGVYDNYISAPNIGFGENWKMIWSCNDGSPTMLIAGGGGSANNELALLAPPAIAPVTSNLSGLVGGHNDISDIVIDPSSNEMFTIYSTPAAVSTTDNIIYKHLPPYNASTLAWQTNTTYFALKEPMNRPYLSALDNSSNTLAVNSFYLFYWDGKNLKAINKANGAIVGTPVSFSANIKLAQGGIYADECNNVFIGFTNGLVKVLKFNGADFDDAPADISIAGFATKPVYDLAYDNAHEHLYVSGNGFVASVDISEYCPSAVYSISVDEDCLTLTATASVTPVPPVGTAVTYVIYNGATQIASNTTGVFTNLSVGINYTMRAFLNRACGGTQTVTDFTFPPTLLLVTNNTGRVCLPDGTADLTDAAVTAGSAPGQIFSYWKDAAATQSLANPSAAVAGTYFIKGFPAGGGCPGILPVVVPSFPVPAGIPGTDINICYGKSTQLNATGGIGYLWSPSTYLDNPDIPNPQVINPAPGTHIYHLTITDMNGCRSLDIEQVAVIVAAPPQIGVFRDTAIAINQPLQLNATDINNSGFISYSWTPPTGLSNPFIANPVAVLDRDVVYTVNASTVSDCKGSAVINVKVYQGPEIYVPSAFTPDGDGLNDILKAILVGMKEFHYFNIYNRWGQLVFTTSNHDKGWDGKLGGLIQGSATFVWMAEAIDYKGNLIKRKGTVTLIR